MKNCLLILFVSMNGYCFSQLIFSENFPGASLPAGWTQETLATDGGWLTGDNYELGSAIFPVTAHGNFAGTNDKCFCDKSNDFLKSPSIDLSSFSSVWLSFDYSYLDFAPQHFTLEISTDGGFIWSDLDNLPSSAAGYYGWWQKNYYDLSDYAGYDDVKIGFRYSDGGEWWSYGAAIDEIKIFQPLEHNIALDSIYTSSIYAATGTGIVLNGVVTNYGTNTIHSLDATWNDGVLNSTITITGLNLEPLEQAAFTHTVDYIPADAVKYNLSLTVSNPDGSADPSMADNVLYTNVHGTSIKPHKNAVAELATGTWCAWCVRGHVYMDSMYMLYPDNFIGIDVHNSDPMTVDIYDSLMYQYQNFLNYNGGAAYPSIIAEHKFYMDPLLMPVDMLPYINETVPLYMGIYGSYNDTTGIADINIRTTFVSQLDSIDYRINLILTEDSVTGSGSSWNQWNAYAGGDYGVMGGYEILPDPVPASLMHYDHVARFLADGWNGAIGSLPWSADDGDLFHYNYSIAINPDWNTEKLNVITTVTDQSNGKIINAAVIKLTDLIAEVVDTSDTDTTLAILAQENKMLKIKLYPNPADEAFIANIYLPHMSEVYIRISDITGKTIAEKNYGILNNETKLPVNTISFADGIYYVTISADNHIETRKLTVVHRK